MWGPIAVGGGSVGKFATCARCVVALRVGSPKEEANKQCCRGHTGSYRAWCKGRCCCCCVAGGRTGSMAWHVSSLQCCSSNRVTTFTAVGNNVPTIWLASMLSTAQI